MSTTIQQSQFEFEIGESIVCIHHDQCPYDAKVIGISDVDGTLNYNVHYLGWNSRYDEKIPVGQEKGKMHKGALAQYIEQHRSTINSAYLVDYDERIKKIALKAKDQKNSQKFSKKARSINSTEMYKKSLDSAGKGVPEWIIKLPSNLLEILIEDQQLMKEGFLYRIPAKCSIDTILAKYQEAMIGEGESSGEEVDRARHASQICAMGIVDYFNTALGYQLLYPTEREQYNQLITGVETEDEGAATMKDEFRASEKYGLVHLLRLFIKLPGLIKYDHHIGDVPKHIAPRVDEFVKFLSDNCSDFHNGKMDYEQMASN
ncbi:hypothetical protein CAEBREN_21685 [Caenorhabditis brenneri]|uniref:Uncharacterized protein n=1 Tax=Caenorhabditis brenneri TaxID=135651 RepID=G0MH46_CAEBE|nr:hypothetical protein CAEBREN_21685 [Caenorhabditis brenneri]